MTRELNRSFGFTLIEIVIVISILATLVGVASLSYTSAQRSGRDSGRQASLKRIQNALELYYADHHSYPGLGDCEGGGSPGVVIRAAGPGQRCNDVCGVEGETCLSIGTDVGASNEKFRRRFFLLCVDSFFEYDCDYLLEGPYPRCGEQTQWTNCRCEQTAAAAWEDVGDLEGVLVSGGNKYTEDIPIDPSASSYLYCSFNDGKCYCLSAEMEKPGNARSDGDCGPTYDSGHNNGYYLMCP